MQNVHWSTSWVILNLFYPTKVNSRISDADTCVTMLRSRQFSIDEDYCIKEGEFEFKAQSTQIQWLNVIVRICTITVKL